MRLFTANPDDTERLSLALDRAGIATTTHIVGNGAPVLGRGALRAGRSGASQSREAPSQKLLHITLRRLGCSD